VPTILIVCPAIVLGTDAKRVTLAWNQVNRTMDGQVLATEMPREEFQQKLNSQRAVPEESRIASLPMRPQKLWHGPCP